MNGLYIALGVLAVAVLWGASVYNALVRLRNHCREAWSNVDAELKRRHNLIPNLVETVKGYAKYEDTALQAVTEARAEALNSADSAASQATQENALVGSLKHLFALAEGYPELKASQHFLELQQELANTEDRIQAARRFYNANVRDLNTRIEVFPSSLVAGLFKFQRNSYFEVDSLDVRAPVKVKLAE